LVPQGVNVGEVSALDARTEVPVRASGAIGLLAGVAAVALLPLYGDPVPSSLISHPEWARMLLQGLDLVSETPGVSDTAGHVFAALSGRESRTFSADQYARGNRVELSDDGGVKALRPVGGIGEAVFALGIARPGDYRLRFRISGKADAEAELTKAGADAVVRRFGVPAVAEVSWVDAGSVYLDPGAYETTLLMPEGGALQFVEVAPPCVEPIEPRGGWKPSAVTTTRDVAVTLLQALDLESELPPAGEAIEFHGSDMRLDDGSQTVEAAEGSGAFQAGPRGARVLLVADVPQAGLYTLAGFGVPAGGQRWLADGCRTSLVCPTAVTTPAWHPILSGLLQQGRHVFAATLGPGTRIERLRLEPKKDSPEDYAGTVERLGLALGPDGPVTRAKAEEARRFLEQRRVNPARAQCGDVLSAGTLAADLAAAAGAGGPGGPGGGGGGIGGGGGGGGGTVPPPITPAVPPASPTLPNSVSGR
jgi:hypothetical protein